MDDLDVFLVSVCSIIYVFHLKPETRKCSLHVQLFSQVDSLTVTHWYYNLSLSLYFNILILYMLSDQV